jgi:LCP family protein required for cell wall assembly
MRTKFPIPQSWLIVGLATGFTLTALITAILTFAIVRDLVASWGETDGLPIFVPQSPQAMEAALQRSLGDRSEIPLQSADGPPPKPWDDTSRVNILVLGLDYRDWLSGGGAPRTDTMILVSMDPISRTMGILSIPRDLWVNIPGFEPNKINAAYRLGEVYRVEGGGPGLAMRTVTALLGMPVDYYVQIDFAAFEKFIDELGGVKLTVPEEIKVDPIDGNTKTLQPGVQALPGNLALAYARARGTAGGDFDRAERQQQVILGIRNRIMSRNTLPRLIRRAVPLYESLASGVHTNLSLVQVIRMTWLAQQIPEESIQRSVIGPNQATFGTAADGQDILVPIPEAIRTQRDEIFSIGPIGPQTTITDQIEMVKAERAQVRVLNGTSTPGVAAEAANFLKENQISVLEAGNASERYSQTTLIDYSGNPQTVEYLTGLMGISTTNVYHRYNVDDPADILLLVGEDWASENALP